MNESIVIVESAKDAVVKTNSKTLYFVIKRFFDILVGLIGLVILIPLTVIIKVAYMLTGDFSSIFFKHKRIGKHGETIYIYKYRSMVPNAEAKLKTMLKDKKFKKEFEKNYKLDNDPRITKIGKIIRTTSIDELPQFINLLKGDMSLIGPRPLVEGELDAQNGNHEIYESVRPGITGWWACNGRSATNYDERLKLEYYYVRNCSIKLDIKCIYRTIIAVLKRQGAK
ncbi:MAG: sugar transferase [Bacilli bacterium]|nr:sugar transferase [Bacilli bacterium]